MRGLRVIRESVCGSDLTLRSVLKLHIPTVIQEYMIGLHDMALLRTSLYAPCSLQIRRILP